MPDRPEMRSVYSSAVDRVGYDEEQHELHVEWSDGKRSIYSDVPPPVADQVQNAWSVGKALHQMVKGNYGHRYG